MSGYLRKMARKQLRANMGLTKRIARDHEDVLQDIETLLVSAYRRYEEVDDAVCHAAIESLLTGGAARDPFSALLVEGLTRIRQLRQDVPDNVWRDALRVVAQSIRTHSERRPGDIDYLAFVAVFIP